MPRRRPKTTKPCPAFRVCQAELLEDRRLLSGSEFSATVTARSIYYNNSVYDGNTAGAASEVQELSAEDAIKTAYMAANLDYSAPIDAYSVTSYSKGINGIIVAITGAHGPITANDFTFRMSSHGLSAGNDPSSWGGAPTPSVTVFSDSPVLGTDRVHLIWPDNSIVNRYLKVIVKGNDDIGGHNTNTGLSESDHFFYGNKVGDTFYNELGSAFTANDTDVDRVLHHAGGIAFSPSNFYDFNKDFSVDAADVLLAQDNAGMMGKIGLPPGSLAGKAADVILNADRNAGWSGAPAPLLPEATISGNLSEIGITLEFSSSIASPVLDADVTGTPLTKSWDGHVLTLSGTASPTTYETVLRSITYDVDSYDDPRFVYDDVRIVDVYEILPYFFEDDATIRPNFAEVVDAVATKSLVADDIVDTEFTITLSTPNIYPVSVHYETQDGTAVAGVDYESTSGDVTFAPGEVSMPVTVNILHMPGTTSTVQPDKSIIIELSDPQNTELFEWPDTIGESHGVIAIRDSVLTNPLPDPLAEISTAAFGAAVTVSASVATGNVRAVVPTITGPLADQAALVHASETKPSGVLSFAASVPNGPGGVAYGAIATLTGSLVGSADFERIEGVAAGTTIQLPTPYYGAESGLETGTYTWELSVAYQFEPLGSPPIMPPEVVKYHGVQSVVVRSASPYGTGVWIAGQDQLFIQEEPEKDDTYPFALRKPAGVTYVMGDGEAVFFAYDKTNDSYATPQGYFLKLEKEAGGYTIRDPYEVTKQFSADGLLKTVALPNKRVTTYEHNGDKTLKSITDPLDHKIVFDYQFGKLKSITDAAGRVTQIQPGGLYPITITSPPPEDGGAGLNTIFTGQDITLPGPEFNAEHVYFSNYYGTTNGVFDAHIAAREEFLIVSAKSRLPGTAPDDFVTDDEMTATIYEDSPYGDTATMTLDDRGWVTEYTDFKGQTTNYERYDNGLIKSITLPGATEPEYSFTYDDDGNMRTRTTKARPATADYDALPETTEQWIYDRGFGVPTRYKDRNGNWTDYDVNPQTGELREVDHTVQSVIGEPSVLVYTNNAYTLPGSPVGPGVVYRTARFNVVTYHDYAIYGNQLVDVVTEAQGHPEEVTRTYIYNFDTMTLKRFIDERHKVTDYEYDDLDRLTKVIEPRPEPGAERPEWIYRYYDDSGLLKEVEDPRHKITSHSYIFYTGGSLFSHTITQPKPTDQQGHPVWVYTYDGMGRLDNVRDPRVGITDYEYDSNGNLTDVTLPRPYSNPETPRPAWHYEYNSLNLMESARDPEQHVTDYLYDEREQLYLVRGPADNNGARPETKYKHDKRGLVVGVTDPMGRFTEYGYNSLGWLEKVVGPDPNSTYAQAVTHYKYDKFGNLRFEVVGPNTSLTQTTEYEYDHLNRLRSEIQPAPRAGAMQPKTAYTYWDTGELKTLKDPNGNLTTWMIDDLGRVTEEIDPLQKSTKFQYDAGGNLEQKIDRLGRVTGYIYDALNRMTDEKWFTNVNSLETPINTISYRYDLAGSLTSASDPSASYTYLPDNLGRVQRTTINIPGLSEVTLINQYDKNSNRFQLNAEIGGTPDFVNYYQYDALNRLVDLKQGPGSQGGGNVVAEKQVGFQYKLDGQLETVNRFDHFVPDSTIPTEALGSTSYHYDAAGRLSLLNTTAASFISLGFYYDDLQRIGAFTHIADPAGLCIYNYDNNNQVIHEGLDPDVDYDYDLGGNRIEADGVTSTPGAGNRLLNDGTHTYQYDDEGNLSKRTHDTTLEVLDLYWDHRNRLVKLTLQKPGEPDANYELNYAYDAFNRRVSRHETTFADGGEGVGEPDGYLQEKYIYDGDDVVLDFQNVDGAGWELARRYLHGPAVDQVLAQENVAEQADVQAENRVYWMLADNLGTIRDIVDNSGALVQHYRYDVFGRILAGDTSLTRYLYTGREFDASTGLQYNRNRWYDSGTGRWLSQDPIGFAGGDTNLYRYVRNNTTNATDPYGLAVFYAEYTPLAKPSWLPIPDWIWDSLSEPDPSDFVMPLSGMARKIGARAVGKVVKKSVAKEVTEQAAKGLPKGFDAAKGFATFAQFKSAFGVAGKGKAWHHAVEQTINSGQFSAELLHNPANLFSLPHGKGSVHAKISGYYSSKIPGLTGDLTVRQWLSKKSFREQFEYGIDIIKQFGGSKYLPKRLR